MNIYIHPIILYIAVVPVAVIVWYAIICIVYISARSRSLARIINNQNVWDIILAVLTALVIISPLGVISVTLLIYRTLGLL